jgi:hypothetical protein
MKLTFVSLQFHGFHVKPNTIKLQGIKVRNYLHENCEFVSRTADSVKRVPRAEHQFVRYIYLYS